MMGDENRLEPDSTGMPDEMQPDSEKTADDGRGDPGKAAVFIDRDGVLNREVNYLHQIEDFEWIPGAREAVRKLNEAGFVVVVVTNQSGVARGYFTEEDVRALHDFMRESLAEQKARIDAFYYSPYHPEGALEQYRRVSESRKPGTALFEQALDEWGIAPSRSFLIGDKNTDIEPGLRLGMTTLMVETGYGLKEKHATNAHYIAPSIVEAVDRILELHEKA